MSDITQIDSHIGRTDMADRNFNALVAQTAANGRFLCVGIDPDLEQIPSHLHGKKNVYQLLIDFCIPIIDATASYAGAYKPNIAFFEGLGLNGLRALEKIIVYIREHHPLIPIVLDGKRNDIGNSSKGYAAMAFIEMLADALTINPYLGPDACAPFLARPEKGAIVLCHTSNPGSRRMQEQIVRVQDDEYAQIVEERRLEDPDFEMEQEMPLYQLLAHQVALRSLWNGNGNCALVVGATFPAQMREVRHIVGDMLILAPGIGKQGGDLEATVLSARNSRGAGFLINVSSDISYASSGKDFARAAGARARYYHESITSIS